MSAQKLGKVQSVDTGNVTILVENEAILNQVQVNQVVKIRSSRVNEEIVGMITKILKKSSIDRIEEDLEETLVIENVVKVSLIGTLILKEGEQTNKFKRTLNVVPSIDSDCTLLESDSLSEFMTAISTQTDNPLSIGTYSISENSICNLDGNKFFQRHATIVGGTGSGKSFTVANLIEKASKLDSTCSLLFDLHGEYAPLAALDNTEILKIAGPSDSTKTEGVFFLPYWLLSHEEIESLMLDRSDSNAPNQSRILFDTVIKLKKAQLEADNRDGVLENFTVDSPVPYKLTDLIDHIDAEDQKMVPGSNGREKQGPLFGKLTRFVQRLGSKKTDRRLNFLFNEESEVLDYDYLSLLIKKLLDFSENGIKIIDFSEVPSDLLPMITGLMSRLIFSIQQWINEEKRHPIAIFCDEAHLYIPSETKTSIEEKALKSFERIAKEGRKYGLSLVVISQRPSDVNKTVLSQCGNFVAMRLTNPDDQNVIRRLFPDNLGGFSEILPILDTGEAIIVGDASLLPSRVLIDKPSIAPKSATVDFWDIWATEKQFDGYLEAVEALRKQKKD